jgi:MFS family permease
VSGVIIDEIIADLGITRTSVSTLYLIGTCTSAACLPMMGRAIDRHGARLAIGPISLFLGAACFLLAAAESQPVLLLAFFLLRFWGQGSMQLAGQTAINLWWVKKRGVVMSIGRATQSLTMLAAIPVAMRRLTVLYGWRNM